MTSISNLKIGGKIGFVLGGFILILVGLSALSLWSNHTTDRMALTMNQRLTKARLAERVDADSTAILADAARMIVYKKSTQEILDDIADRKKSRAAALEQFRALVDTPTSIKHGSDMAELVQSVSESSKVVVDLAAAGRFADALKQFKTYTSRNAALRAKATEASQFQQNKFAEEEKENKQTASTMWIALISGSLFAIVAAILGGVALTRNIALPLAKAVAHFGDIANGDLSKDAPPEFQARGDELGTLARAKQTMIVALRKMVQEITGGIQVLSSASTELLSSSTEMTAGSRHASDKAHTVSAAAEQMTSNITSVAAGMEQATTNLAHVASATGK